MNMALRKLLYRKCPYIICDWNGSVIIFILSLLNPWIELTNTGQGA